MVRLKYKLVVETLKAKGVVSLAEMEKMKTLKHGTKDKDMVYEVPGFCPHHQLVSIDFVWPMSKYC